MSIGPIYIGMLLTGVVYALLSGLMGWLSDLGGDGVHFDHGHLAADHPHAISGTTIATFITGFGAGGILGHYGLEWNVLPGLGLAVGSGLVLAFAAYLVLDWIFSQTQAGSEFRGEEVVGRMAEVITPIPENGTGEITFLVKGQRETGPARAIDGISVARGVTVVIEKIVGTTHYVRPKSS